MEIYPNRCARDHLVSLLSKGDIALAVPEGSVAKLQHLSLQVYLSFLETSLETSERGMSSSGQMLTFQLSNRWHPRNLTI